MRQRGFIATGWLYLIAGLAILAILSGIAYKIRESGKDVIRLEWAEANRAQRDAEAKKAEKAATTLETGHAKARVVYRDITRTVDRYIERPVYRNECFDADGLNSANMALKGALTDDAKAEIRGKGRSPDK